MLRANMTRNYLRTQRTPNWSLYSNNTTVENRLFVRTGCKRLQMGVDRGFEFRQYL